MDLARTGWPSWWIQVDLIGGSWIWLWICLFLTAPGAPRRAQNSMLKVNFTVVLTPAPAHGKGVWLIN